MTQPAVPAPTMIKSRVISLLALAAGAPALRVVTRMHCLRSVGGAESGTTDMRSLAVVVAIAALGACAKKQEPAETPAATESAAPAPIASEELAAPAAPQTVAAAPEDVEPAARCPVIDSRNWKAWTAPDGTGTTLHVAGEVDLPTPGYQVTWDLGPTDRMMPPGQRVILKAAPPDGLVAQVVTPTPVSFETPGAYPEYRTVIIVCDGAAIAEIEGVGPG